MRLIKCSDDDDEFSDESKAKYFFNDVLVNNGGRFYFGNQIGAAGLSAGDTLLFQYKGKLRFTAKAASGRLIGPEGEHYFLVDTNTIYETKDLSFLSLQELLLRDCGLAVSLEGQAWTKIPETERAQEVIDKLKTKQVKTRNVETTDFEELTSVILGKQEGPRFQNNLLKRRAIELYAMKLAIDYYERKLATLYKSIENVSGNKPYDLRCLTRNGSELRVEVKGTTANGDQVILTRNEVENARTHPNVGLFIVKNIKLIESNGNFSASEGEIVILEPWILADEDLSALSFAYKVDKPSID